MCFIHFDQIFVSHYFGNVLNHECCVNVSCCFKTFETDLRIWCKTDSKESSLETKKGGGSHEINAHSITVTTLRLKKQGAG